MPNILRHQSNCPLLQFNWQKTGGNKQFTVVVGWTFKRIRQFAQHRWRQYRQPDRITEEVFEWIFPRIHNDGPA